METEELKNIWKKYDESLDKIEPANREIIESIISGETVINPFRMKLKSIIGILAAALIILLVITVFAFKPDINTIQLLGAILLSLNVIYLSGRLLKYYKMMHRLMPVGNSISETMYNINRIKSFIILPAKQQFFVCPLTVLSLILIISDSINFDIVISEILHVSIFQYFYIFT